jgi:hypothetical protein
LQSFPKIQGRHYFAIFVLASATLSYQILITRFFSVMLYYHFAFAAISLAMLGLTRGAMQVYRNPERYAPERVGAEFARHAARFAITGVGLRSRDIVSVAIARDRERVDRVQLIARREESLHPQATIRFNADHDLVRIFRMVGDELVEGADTHKPLGQSPSRDLLACLVHQMNVVMVFCPVVADEQHRDGPPSPR